MRRAMMAGGAALLWAHTAFAQGASPQGPEIDAGHEARVAFEEGVQLLRTDQWAEAEKRFRRSIALAARPSATYDLAFVLFRVGRARESSRLLRGLLDAPEGSFDPQYRDYARTLMPHVMAELSTLRVIVAPAYANIRIDGEIVPPSGAERSVAVDAGAHRVEALATGFAAETFEVATQAGDEIEREVTLSPVDGPAGTHAGRAPEPAAPEGRAVTSRVQSGDSRAWALWATTAVLTTGTATTGVLSLIATKDLSTQLNTFPGDAGRIEAARSHARTLALVTDVLAGTTVVAGALAIYFTLPGSHSTASRSTLAVGVGVPGIQFRGSY